MTMEIFLIAILVLLFAASIIIRFINELRRKNICTKYSFTSTKMQFSPFNTVYSYKGDWENYKVDVLELRSAPYSSISVSLFFSNPAEVFSTYKIKGLFIKPRNFFGNKLDKILLVQSKPASAGKFMFNSEILFKRILFTQSLYWIFIKALFGGMEIIRIVPSGKITINAPKSGFNENKMVKLLNIGKKIIELLGEYK
jgi:hypothetical protein